jgi:hypothetical protein
VRTAERLGDLRIGVVSVEDVVIEVGADGDRLERDVDELRERSDGSFASRTV